MPNDVEKALQKATAAWSLGEEREATCTLLTEARKHQNERLFSSLAYIYLQRGKYLLAARFYKKAFYANAFNVEYVLGAYYACLKSGKITKARKYLRAAERIAPQESRVLKAKALLAANSGEYLNAFKHINDVPNYSIFASMDDANVQRLKDHSSVVAGHNALKVMLVVFAGEGLRSVLVGYRDGKIVLPKPLVDYTWLPLSQHKSTEIRIVSVDIEDTTSMIGLRVEGLEEDLRDKPIGILEIEFKFPNLRRFSEDAYAGVFNIDINKAIHFEPTRYFLAEIAGIPEGDLFQPSSPLLSTQSFQKESNMSKNPRVLLSYAKEDSEKANIIFEGLQKRGHNVWKDDRRLITGDDWEARIEDALEEADFAIVCLSSASVEKIGYVQKEMRKILELGLLRPDSMAFAFPVLLDDCNVPRKFRPFQWINFKEGDVENFIKQLSGDLHLQYEKQRTS